MTTPSMDQILSLLAPEDRSSSLKKGGKELLRLVNHSLAANLSSKLLEFQDSPESHVRILLIQIIEEIGFKATKHSPKLLDVLLKFLSDGRDVIAVKQSIVSGSNLFYSGFNELIVQFQQRGQVEPWLEEIWAWMHKFKRIIFQIALEIAHDPGHIAVKVLALNFLEMVVLLFSSDINDPEKSTMEGVGPAVNTSSLSALVGHHPVLDQNQLMLEANRALRTLLNLLQFSFTIGSLPGSLVVTLLNCSAAIARKRPEHADIILSTMFGYDPNYQIVNGDPCHVACIQLSLITAFSILVERNYSHTQKWRERMRRKIKDMGDDMIKRGYRLPKPPKNEVRLSPFYDNETFNHKVDWREDGAVSSVKKQGKCDCCWAFMAVGAVEGIHHIMCGSPLLDLSIQELVDGDPISRGCIDGRHNNAFKYIQENGISCDIDYPYVVDEVPVESHEKNCLKNQLCRKRKIVTIDGYQRLPMDDKALEEAVRRQPIAVMLRVPEKDFTRLMDYGIGKKYGKMNKIFEGSFYLDKKHTMCHGMLLVGHGVSSLERPYWILKNSWGKRWGIDGYMYLLRNNSKEGMYWINKDAWFPTISG